MAYPTEYRYSREHVWVAVAGTTASLGITEHAQISLCDIVFVDMPKVGDPVKANEVFGSVESIKAVSDLFSPVSGKVIAINQELDLSPEKINKNPNGTWVIQVEMSDPAELEPLLDSKGYMDLVG